MAQILDTHEGLELLSEHIGVDLGTLQKAAEDKREAARIARLQAQIEEEQERQRIAEEKARENFTAAWKAGDIIVRIDGKLKSKPCDICTEGGEPDTAAVISLAMNWRRKLLQGFKSMDTCGKTQKGATIRRSVPCTCGKEHFVEIFITGYSTK